MANSQERRPPEIKAEARIEARWILRKEVVSAELKPLLEEVDRLHEELLVAQEALENSRALLEKLRGLDPSVQDTGAIDTLQNTHDQLVGAKFTIENKLKFEKRRALMLAYEYALLEGREGDTQGLLNEARTLYEAEVERINSSLGKEVNAQEQKAEESRVALEQVLSQANEAYKALMGADLSLTVESAKPGDVFDSFAREAKAFVDTVTQAREDRQQMLSRNKLNYKHDERTHVLDFSISAGYTRNLTVKEIMEGDVVRENQASFDRIQHQIEEHRKSEPGMFAGIFGGKVKKWRDILFNLEMDQEGKQRAVDFAQREQEFVNGIVNKRNEAHQAKEEKLKAFNDFSFDRIPKIQEAYRDYDAKAILASALKTRLTRQLKPLQDALEEIRKAMEVQPVNLEHPIMNRARNTE